MSVLDSKAKRDIRDRDHRMLLAAGVVGGGSPDRDVSGRRESVARGRHHASAMGTRVSASTVSDLNQKIYGEINERRERPLVGDFPCAFLDGLWLKRSWGGEVKNVSVLVAIWVAQIGYREIPAVSEGAKEDWIFTGAGKW